MRRDRAPSSPSSPPVFFFPFFLLISSFLAAITLPLQSPPLPSHDSPRPPHPPSILPSLPPRCHPAVTPSHSHSLVCTLIRLTSAGWRGRAAASGIGRLRQPPWTHGLLSRVDMWYKISVLSPLHRQVCTRQSMVCWCEYVHSRVCVCVRANVHCSQSGRAPQR